MQEALSPCLQNVRTEYPPPWLRRKCLMDSLEYYFLENSSTDQMAYAVMCSALVLEVVGSNPGPVKSNTEWPTACHHCGFFSKGAVLPKRIVAAKGQANTLHVWA